MIERKRIYYYYNHKYSKDGHLFRERFKSEPVNDLAYFLTLLRYIRQNHVKARIVETVKDYEYSSWSEYCDWDGTLFPVCDTHTVLHFIASIREIDRNREEHDISHVMKQVPVPMSLPMSLEG